MTRLVRWLRGPERPLAEGATAFFSGFPSLVSMGRGSGFSLALRDGFGSGGVGAGSLGDQQWARREFFCRGDRLFVGTRWPVGRAHDNDAGFFAGGRRSTSGFCRARSLAFARQGPGCGVALGLAAVLGGVRGRRAGVPSARACGQRLRRAGVALAWRVRLWVAGLEQEEQLCGKSPGVASPRELLPACSFCSPCVWWLFSVPEKRLCGPGSGAVGGVTPNLRCAK